MGYNVLDFLPHLKNNHARVTSGNPFSNGKWAIELAKYTCCILFKTTIGLDTGDPFSCNGLSCSAQPIVWPYAAPWCIDLCYINHSIASLKFISYHFSTRWVHFKLQKHALPVAFDINKLMDLSCMILLKSDSVASRNYSLCRSSSNPQHFLPLHVTLLPRRILPKSCCMQWTKTVYLQCGKDPRIVTLLIIDDKNWMQRPKSSSMSSTYATLKLQTGNCTINASITIHNHQSYATCCGTILTTK